MYGIKHKQDEILYNGSLYQIRHSNLSVFGEDGPFTLHTVTGDKVPWNMFSVAEQSSVTEPADDSSSN